MRRNVSVWLMVLVLGTLSSVGWGADRAYWLGEGDNISWMDAANWSDGSAPRVWPPDTLNDWVTLSDLVPGNDMITISIPEAGVTCGSVMGLSANHDYVINGGPLTLGQIFGGSFFTTDQWSKKITFNCPILLDSSTWGLTVNAGHNKTLTPVPVFEFNAPITAAVLETGPDHTGNGILILNTDNPNLAAIHNWALTEIIAGSPGALGPIYQAYGDSVLGVAANVSVSQCGPAPSWVDGPMYLRNHGMSAHTLTVDVTTSGNGATDQWIVQPNPDGGPDNLTVRITGTSVYNQAINIQTLASTTVSLGSDTAGGWIQLVGSGGHISGPGRLVVDSTGSNVYIAQPQSHTGGTFVNRGTAYFDGANALSPGGDVYVSSAGTLVMGYYAGVNATAGNLFGGDGGTGTINTLGATLTVNGTLAPGNGTAGSLGALNVTNNAGTLALVGGATFDVQTPGTAQDTVTVENALTLGGPLTVNCLAGAEAGTYTLMTAVVVSGSFSGSPTFVNLPAGMSGSVSVDATSVKVTLSAGGVPGDVNGDGHVNAADLAIVLGAMDSVPPSDARADLDADGAVTSTDLSIVLANME